jgi:hypothetical protein
MNHQRKVEIRDPRRASAVGGTRELREFQTMEHALRHWPLARDTDEPDEPKDEVPNSDDKANILRVGCLLIWNGGLRISAVVVEALPKE